MLEAITIRVEAIASRLEAIASRLVMLCYKGSKKIKKAEPVVCLTQWVVDVMEKPPQSVRAVCSM